jgi:DNA-binding transcriptional ArsR family regulator
MFGAMKCLRNNGFLHLRCLNGLLLIVRFRQLLAQEEETGRVDSVEGPGGRLSARLAATLEPGLQDALDHPVRREVLRALNRSERSRSLTELEVELCGFRLGQLDYHLRVLRRAGTVASEVGGLTPGRNRDQFASEVSDDGQVRAVLRATEQQDRERREAAARAGLSPLLTMFRLPRPIRTIRLRGRQVDSEQER